MTTTTEAREASESQRSRRSHSGGSATGRARRAGRPQGRDRHRRGGGGGGGGTRRAGRRLSPLTLATAGAVAALTAVLGYLWAYLFEAPVIGALVGTMFGLGALSLLAILAGWRWAPALGVLLTAVVGGLLVGANWTEFVRSVSNPRDPLYLPLALLIPPMALATRTGDRATAQNCRLAALPGAPRAGWPRRWPPWEG